MPDPVNTAPAPASDPAPVAPVPVKPGYMTTEFWLNAFTVLVGAAMTLSSMLHLAPDNKFVQVLGLVAMVLGATGHTVSRTMVKNAAQVFLIGLLLLGAGCRALDMKVVKTWQDREAVLMQQLGAYVAADATKTPDAQGAEKTKITAHLLQVQQDITKISADDENALMAELLAYVSADPKRDADSKQAKSDSIQAHLRLFTDEIK